MDFRKFYLKRERSFFFERIRAEKLSKAKRQQRKNAKIVEAPKVS